MPIAVAGGTVDLMPFQIVLSVSITPKGISPTRDTPRFPAVVDNGCNLTFLLQERHLNAWARLQRAKLKKVGERHPYGKQSPVHAANVWLHPNTPGTRNDAANARPFCIHLDPGIVVCSDDVRQPRLPLLGLPALSFGQLQLLFHWGRQKSVTLRTTPWWFWLLG
jgi:hypothetical protein